MESLMNILFCKFTGESDSEKILKIGWECTQLPPRVWSLAFLEHCIHSYYTRVMCVSVAKQVRVQLLTSADIVPLHACTAVRPRAGDRYLLSAQNSAANSLRAAGEWWDRQKYRQTDIQTDRRTDGRTTDSFIDPFPHTLRALTITYAYHWRTFHWRFARASRTICCKYRGH